MQNIKSEGETSYNWKFYELLSCSKENEESDGRRCTL
jgi:hypothetical protein